MLPLSFWTIASSITSSTRHCTRSCRIQSRGARTIVLEVANVRIACVNAHQVSRTWFTDIFFAGTLHKRCTSLIWAWMQDKVLLLKRRYQDCITEPTLHVQLAYSGLRFLNDCSWNGQCANSIDMCVHAHQWADLSLHVPFALVLFINVPHVYCGHDTGQSVAVKANVSRLHHRPSTARAVGVFGGWGFRTIVLKMANVRKA